MGKLSTAELMCTFYTEESCSFLYPTFIIKPTSSNLF
jgi:hypothetical protein